MAGFSLTHFIPPLAIFWHFFLRDRRPFAPSSFIIVHIKGRSSKKRPLAALLPKRPLLRVFSASRFSEVAAVFVTTIAMLASTASRGES
jgi:hypothetical protein